MESEHLSSLKCRYKDEMDVIKDVWQEEKDALYYMVQNSELLKKDECRATHLKEIATGLYTSGHISDAIKLYSNALYIAEYNSELFGTILANISACNYDLGFWEQCVYAVDMCLKTAYPKAFLPKVYIRKIKALARLGDRSIAKNVLPECINCIQGCNLTEKQKDKLIEEARTALKTEFEEVYFKGEFLGPEIEENPDLQNASKKATLCYNKEFGRHVIAKENIKRGECILIKRPYVEIGMSTCANCYARLKTNIIPCMVCTTTAYCSETCRDCNKNVHKWECLLFLRQFYYLIDVRVKLAFRVFLKGLESGYKISLKKIEEDLRLGHEVDDFSYFQQLYSDFNFFEKSVAREYAIDCCIIMAYLSMNEDFMNFAKTKEVFGNDVLLIGRDILHYSNICNFNSYRWKDDKKTIGLSLSYSFFNHSCVPNTETWTIDSIDVIKALKDISAGEQIFISYLKESKYKHASILHDTWNIICNCGNDVVKDEAVICPKSVLRKNCRFDYKLQIL